MPASAIPSSAIPFLVFFVGAFATFIAVVGGVSFWSGRSR